MPTLTDLREIVRNIKRSVGGNLDVKSEVADNDLERKIYGIGHLDPIKSSSDVLPKNEVLQNRTINEKLLGLAQGMSGGIKLSPFYDRLVNNYLKSNLTQNELLAELSKNNKRISGLYGHLLNSKLEIPDSGDFFENFKVAQEAINPNITPQFMLHPRANGFEIHPNPRDIVLMSKLNRAHENPSFKVKDTGPAVFYNLYGSKEPDAITHLVGHESTHFKDAINNPMIESNFRSGMGSTVEDLERTGGGHFLPENTGGEEGKHYELWNALKMMEDEKFVPNFLPINKNAKSANYGKEATEEIIKKLGLNTTRENLLRGEIANKDAERFWNLLLSKEMQKNLVFTSPGEIPMDATSYIFKRAFGGGQDDLNVIKDLMRDEFQRSSRSNIQLSRKKK